MKIESPDFDKHALVRLLKTDYALDVARLEFVPWGEESHSYIATTLAGERFFVKVHMASTSSALEARYRFVHHLRTYENYEWAISPHLTTTGAYVASYRTRAVAAFDYVSGVSKATSDLTAPQVGRFAGQLAVLHSSVTTAQEFGVPTESYAISFKSWLLEVLQAIEQPLLTTHAWAKPAYDLIRREKPRILDVLAQVEASGAILCTTELPWAVTHGDLASHNIIQDEQGQLVIIDWGKLCLAPAARDLVGLWGEGNEALLEAYFRTLDRPTLQLQRTLTYYFGYYLLATVTDYGSWLLLEEASPEEAENAWRGLQHALAVDLPNLHNTVATICAIAAKVDEKDGDHE